VTVLRSRDNPKVKRWLRLAGDSRYRRKERCALIEGPHLLSALLDRKLKPLAVLVMEELVTGSEVQGLLERAGVSPTALSKRIFSLIADTEAPQGIAAEIAIPEGTADPRMDSVFLEGVQDPGNVGAILRSAAAFGIGSVYLDRNCADPWSPKVLRAAAGAHFSLALLEGHPDSGRLVCTVARGGTALKNADLSGPLCWVFGAEGKGVSRDVLRKAALRITIPIIPEIESLNVAAAAAICLHHARIGRQE